MSTQVLDLYVAFGNRRGNDTVHWILLVVPRNRLSNRGLTKDQMSTGRQPVTLS
ncbi:hypothetical protein EJ04DRAFT_571318 [Polyplosphaeria fusca]|uniref:Uncharacterized protein n=1 Tax=Polyplosphaeria fusca TaxID=682080 RepID=A0A9P4UVQ0_9PLEO|nr:hypothetical protein EJ04DRAFT_571318 [Polyplosphaeria fusca]